MKLKCVRRASLIVYWLNVNVVNYPTQVGGIVEEGANVAYGQEAIPSQPLRRGCDGIYFHYDTSSISTRLV